MPYLFTAKHLHMPDQSEVKSGQRFADGMLWFSGALMGVTGVALLLGTTVFDMPGNVYAVILLLHDIGFFLIALFGMAHIFLGAGIFQPYRGTHKIMFGDGTVSESDALYHLGPLGSRGDRGRRQDRQVALPLQARFCAPAFPIRGAGALSRDRPRGPACLAGRAHASGSAVRQGERCARLRRAGALAPTAPAFSRLANSSAIPLCCVYLYRHAVFQAIGTSMTISDERGDL